MIRQLNILILCITLTSCTANYFISIRNDDSAVINVERDIHTDIIKYYQSEIISNIDTNVTGWRIEYTINNIDSLDMYLPYHPPGFFRFNMEGNSLNITDGNGNPFKVNHGSCCNVILEIKFNRDIRDIKIGSGSVKKKNARTVHISKSRRQLIKEKKKTDVTIILDDSQLY